MANKSNKETKLSTFAKNLGIIASAIGIISVFCTIAYNLGYSRGIIEGCYGVMQDNKALTQENKVFKLTIESLEKELSFWRPNQTDKTYLDVYVSGNLFQGFDVSLSTSAEKYGWAVFDAENKHIRLDYPKGQLWGVFLITVGKPAKLGERKYKDVSDFSKLVVELKGNKGSVIDIMLKDNTDPDTGEETKYSITLKDDWTVFEIPVAYFESADLRKLYAIGFVFDNVPQTVFVRKIQFK